MSRPSRIQDRRQSSRRSPADAPTASAMALVAPGGSRRMSSVPERRASAVIRFSRSVSPRRSDVAPRSLGRSSTSTSTARPESSAAAIVSPSSRSSGTSAMSHSRLTPRATASIGSRLRARSTQAPIPPAAWASARSRSASVVVPDEPSPRTASAAVRGTPPGPRIASSAAKPVEMIRPSPSSETPSSSASGTAASAPTIATAAGSV
jgi:hypothetical protein